jgi:hypothetical protein
MAERSQHRIPLTRAWILLSLSLALHVTDEASTGFLRVYNPTVFALRARWSWFPMPTFGFREWLTGLIILVIILLALSVVVYSGAKWIRIPMAIFAVLMLLNAAGHTIGTIFGRTFAHVTFPRPMPGFWSSPLLAASAAYVLVELYRSRSPKMDVAKGSLPAR